PRFSFVSLDRGSTPATLVSGEYCSGTACSAPLAGRLFRWPVDLTSGRIDGPRTWPESAFFAGHPQLQGAAFVGSTAYQSSSAPAAGKGALYRVQVGKTKPSAWIDAPEDLMVDTPNGLLWSLSEGTSNRFVFGAKLSSYPPP
ncbi:MAG TPA: hypothetical protein PKD61_25580, partial [Polyangiaceae bacterium]|nr:hypothetical protein [Polyangiaceae bacterium]